MKNYFEYSFNEKDIEELASLYSDVKVKQHSSVQKIKSEIKFSRINNLISFLPTDRVLDFGCSVGHFLFLVAGAVREGVGLDISNSIIRRANSRNTYHNIKFKLYDGNNIQSDGQFDKVFILDVLEHVSNPNLLIKEVYGALDAKGELVLEVPFTGWISELLFGRFHQGHLRYYDPDYLIKYIKKFGFKIKKVCIYNSVPLSEYFFRVRFLWRVLNFLVNLIPSKCYPYFGEIIIVAGK